MTHAARRSGPQPPPRPHSQRTKREVETRTSYFEALPQLGSDAFLPPLPPPPEPRSFWSRKLLLYCAVGACTSAAAGLLALSGVLSGGDANEVPEVGLGPMPAPAAAPQPARPKRALRAVAAEAPAYLGRMAGEERAARAEPSEPAREAPPAAEQAEEQAKPATPEPPARAAAEASRAGEERTRTASRRGSSARTADLPATPSRAQVIAAMTRIRPKVQACLPAGRGMATADVTVVGRTGRVTVAQISGQSGQVGSCIARAVRKAKFPKFSNETLTFRYPMAF